MKIYKGDDFFNVNSRPCPKHNGIIRATLSMTFQHKRHILHDLPFVKQPCGCSYDDNWRLTWSLILGPVGLVEMRAS